MTLDDIREAMRLVWNAKPRATTYYHHPRCIEKGPWPHVQCPIDRREDTDD